MRLQQKKGRGLTVFVSSPVRRCPCGSRPFPPTDGFFYGAAAEAAVDKERKDALQATKELVGKFIETRNVSPGNFADVFPAVYKVVLDAICADWAEASGAKKIKPHTHAEK